MNETTERGPENPRAKRKRSRNKSNHRASVEPVTVQINQQPAIVAAAGWKDKPVIIAAITAAATATFWHNVVLPLHNVAIHNELIENRVEAAKVAPLSQEVGSLRARLWDAEHANLFAADNPYPQGFRQVKLGDPIANVVIAFGEDAVDKENRSYWSVNAQSEAISSATYYFDRTSDSKLITHILFHVQIAKPYNDETADPPVLTKRLKEAFGAPILNNAKTAMGWASDGVNIYQRVQQVSFLVMDKNSAPGDWND